MKLGAIHYQGLGLFFFLTTTWSIAIAGTCDTAWNVGKVMAALQGRPAYLRVPLRDKQQRVHEVTVDQIQAFHEAMDRIGRVANVFPNFIICDSADPNAFATTTQNGEVVGITVGMLRLADGDRDMAAAVLGHELAHHTKRHMESTRSREALLGLAGALLGALVDARSARRSGVYTGAGGALGQIGATLVSRKFDRDQEREADEVGFEFMVSAGFNPQGAVRFTEKLGRLGGGAGLFFDTHPGMSERRERFQDMIARNSQAQQIIARASATQAPASDTVAKAIPAPTEIVLDPNYSISDAERSYEQALAAFRSKDIPTGVREMRTAAAASYAPAQAVVGLMYSRGIGGLPKDDVEAVRYYRLAADQGDLQGQNQLGLMYATGRGVDRKDEAEAARLFALAAEQGNPAAQANLGTMYASGVGGLTQDDAEAVRLYRLAAEQNNASGYVGLARMYLNGRGGLQKDEAEGLRLARLAADRGNAAGQTIVGMAYLSGTGGIARNDGEAVRLLRLASNQGNSQAHVVLGNLYENGRAGLTRSASEAINLYQKAAEQGNQTAIGHLKRLGRM